MPIRAIEVRFISNNAEKSKEVATILGGRGISVLHTPMKIEELQTTDTQKLVRDKLLKAFGNIGRPLFVEHTGLYLEHLGGLPGGLTQIFWDTLDADRFAELFGQVAPIRRAKAKTTIAYCNGRQVFVFEGEIAGEITPTPRGPRHFQWDCVFQPEGRAQTFAEMGATKNDISMRRIALDTFATHVEKETT